MVEDANLSSLFYETPDRRRADSTRATRYYTLQTLKPHVIDSN
jgi:hypothetical protein